MAKYKGKEINTSPTEGMIREARRGLDWRKEHGRGGTEVGVARARDIVNGVDLSISTVRRMHSFFARHAVDAEAEGFRPGEKGYPSAGRIAHALWGGTPGKSFAARVVRQADALDERSMSGSVKKALAKKAKDHNEKVGNVASKRTNARTLGAVFRRGVGAYKTNPQSVRPTVKSPEQWAYARVNSFLYVLRNGKFRSGKHDTDLLPKGHPMSSKRQDGTYYEERDMDDVDVSEFLDDQVLDDDLLEDERDSTIESAPVERHIKKVSETEDSYVIEFAKPDQGMMMYDSDDEERTSDNTEYGKRSIHLDASPINEEERRVSMALSSEEPVKRSSFTEVLEHSEEAIDLSFLASGRAPLLLDHDPQKQVGVIESVELDGSARRLRATVRFGKNGLAKDTFEDVVDGIRANVSIGYAINKMERKDKDTYVAKSWSPVEASLVSIPADVSVGVGRSSEPTPEPVTVTVRTEEIPMTNEIDVAAIEAEARKAAQKDATKILDLGARHHQSEMARSAVAEGKSYAEFSGELLEVVGSKRALEEHDIGLSKADVKRFSLVRAIRSLANPADRKLREEAAFEFECSEAAAAEYGRAPEGIMLPSDVMKTWKRDLNSSDESELFGDDFRPQDFIDVLRNASSVMQAGARTLNGLSGDVKIPKKTAAATAAFISSEGGAASESEMTVGQVTMAPKTLGAFTDVTRQLLIQSSMDVEALIRDDLASAIALTIDSAALEGSGSSGNPTGILNTTGINSVTNFSAANPTFAEVVTLETALAEDNALLGNLAYILPAAMYGALKTTEKASGTAQFVIEPGGTMNGYPAIVSNQGTAGNLYFGNYSDLLVGFFGGLDIVVDPYTASTTGTIRVVALQSVDVAVRHAVSFAVGNDG